MGFEADASAATSASPCAATPGLSWISVAPHAPYFIDETGADFTPIGQNDSIDWPELRGLFRRRDMESVERHLLWLKASGVTVLRLMLEYAEGRGRYFEKPAGVFVPDMVRLWDDLFALCERIGLRILLTPVDTFWTWLKWAHHPYNRANGGPLDHPSRLLLCEDTRTLIKGRLGFAVRRWGGSGVLFAWDLWNEIHTAQAQDSAHPFPAFIADLSQHVRRLETALYGRSHPQTVSLFGPELWWRPDQPIAEPIFRHPDLDFCNIHIYREGTIDAPRDTVQPALAMGRIVRDSLKEIIDGRPFFDSEHGPIHTFKDKKKSLPRAFDDEYFRHLQWAHLAGGGAGGGMRWPNRRPHILTTGMREAQAALARFTPLIDWSRFARTNLNEEARVSAKTFGVFACGSRDQALVWLLRRGALDAQGRVRTDAGTVSTEVRVPGLEAGDYRITGWDTTAGREVERLTVAHGGGELRFTPAPIAADRAFAIRRALSAVAGRSRLRAGGMALSLGRAGQTRGRAVGGKTALVKIGRRSLGGTVAGGAVFAISLLFLAGFAVAQGALSPADPARDALPGHGVYDQACAACHNNAEAMRAPAVSTLRSMPAEQIRFALTQGVMRQQGSRLSDDQREQVIAYLAKPQTAAAASADPDAWIEPLRCAADKRSIDLGGARTLTAAGGDPTNRRHLSAAASGLTNAKLARLEVAWTLALPKTNALRVTPVIVGSTLFYAAPSLGAVLALDTRSGCVKWSRRIAIQLRSSPTYGDIAPGRPALVIADALGTLHALDPRDGAEIWRSDPRHDKQAMITGAPVFYQDRIVVPVSAIDVARAADPNYRCCTSHGAVAVVDAADGRVLWTAHTMEAAKPLGRKSSTGQALWGPSGAPIWSTPAIDVKRGLVYVGTGENTSPPNTPTSDAIMALDLKTGARKWVFQASRNDIWNMACRGPTNSGPNCPWTEAESIRRDFDFGAGPILVAGPRGRSVVLAGQKSGQVYGLDPDAGGKVLWTRAFGHGTALGGVHWGMASDGRRLFAPISDPIQKPGDEGSPGLNAVDVVTGRVLWRVAAKPDCENGRAARLLNCATRYGFSAAPMVVDGAVITGSIDGWLRIYDGADGRMLYGFDTARDFTAAANGVAAKGGAIDAQSISAGDGMVFVGSGYGQFAQTPGNVLIAFRPKPGPRAAR